MPDIRISNGASAANMSASDMARRGAAVLQNGAATPIIVRIADSRPRAAPRRRAVQLQTEAGNPSLLLEAKSIGTRHDIRGQLSYNTADPRGDLQPRTVPLTTTSTGAQQKADPETYVGLGMNPRARKTMRPTCRQTSPKLVEATDVRRGRRRPGFLARGRAIASRTNAIFRDEAIAIFGAASRPSSQFRISVDGGPTRSSTSRSRFSPVALSILQRSRRSCDRDRQGVKPGQPVVGRSVFSPVRPARGREQRDDLVLQVAFGNGDVKLNPGPNPSTDISARADARTAQGGIEISRWGGQAAPRERARLPAAICHGRQQRRLRALKQTDITASRCRHPIALGSTLAPRRPRRPRPTLPIR